MTMKIVVTKYASIKMVMKFQLLLTKVITHCMKVNSRVGSYRELTFLKKSIPKTCTLSSYINLRITDKKNNS